LFEHYEISKLEINRIYRYIEKYVKENASGTADIEYEYDNENDNDEFNLDLCED
jgi:hypothetical protein